MKLRISMDDKKMDVRLLDRFVTEGKVSKEDIDKYLQDLPDESENLVRVTDEDTK